MIDPLAIKVLSIAMGCLLLVAATHKWQTGKRFRAVVADYGLLPGFLVSAVAAGIPVLEVALGAGWLSGWFADDVAEVTAAMFLVYALAIGINLRRGRIYISCGCGLPGTAGDNQPLSWSLVCRNILLSALALLPLAPRSERPLGVFDGFAIAAALLAAALLWSAGAQLIRNQSAIRSWRSPNV